MSADSSEKRLACRVPRQSHDRLSGNEPRVDAVTKESSFVEPSRSPGFALLSLLGVLTVFAFSILIALSRTPSSPVTVIGTLVVAPSTLAQQEKEANGRSDTRLAIPDSNDLDAAVKRARDQFGAEYNNAKSAAQKHALAKTIWDTSKRVKTAADQYATLEVARKIAVTVDPDLALQIIDDLAKRFEVRDLSMRREALSQWSIAIPDRFPRDQIWKKRGELLKKIQPLVARAEKELAFAEAAQLYDLASKQQQDLKLRSKLRQLAQQARAKGAPKTPAKGARPGRAKADLLKMNGGTSETEQAVKDGLAWLAKNQRRDGSWSLKEPYADGGTAENSIAATAMALIAFQGAGNTTKDGRHKNVVRIGWRYLIAQQQADGSFFKTGPANHRFYTNAQATIAICKLAAMTNDRSHRDAAQKAIDYLATTQDKSGGWRYYVNDKNTPGSDTSVTAWVVMAFHSAKKAGLRVPEKVLTRIATYLDKATTDGGSQYAYMPDYSAKVSMTAAALHCRQILGWPSDDKRLVRGLEIINKNKMQKGEKDFYYWFYTTKLSFHAGGSTWDKWNPVMRAILTETQESRGKEKGSWSPHGDLWALHGGRLYTTCFAIWMLESYYEERINNAP